MITIVILAIVFVCDLCALVLWGACARSGIVSDGEGRQ